MAKSQVISMDLIMGFIIFIIAISIFFYFIGNVPAVSQKRTLHVEANFVFNNIETIPNHRINFLEDNRVDERKLNSFQKIPYETRDVNNDGLDDYRWPSAAGCTPDTDDVTNYTELSEGTNPCDPASTPHRDTDNIDLVWKENRAAEKSAAVPITAAKITSSDEWIDGNYHSVPGVLDETGDDYNCDGQLTTGLYTDANGNSITDPRDLPGYPDVYTGLNASGIPVKYCTIYGYRRYGIAEDSCKPCKSFFELYRLDKDHGDFDEDGLNDIDEINLFNTNPRKNDTDGDGYRDGEEVSLGKDPNNNADKPARDTGCGGRSCGLDIGWLISTGLSEQEVDMRYNTSDPDRDGLSNYQELIYGTDPLNPDTYSSGKDSEEIIKPSPLSVRDIVVQNINTASFPNVSVCIYFKDKDNHIVRHIGPDIDDIRVGGGVRCGGAPQYVASPDPQCRTAPTISAVSLSKPVFYKDTAGNVKLYTMVVLLCASG